MKLRLWNRPNQPVYAERITNEDEETSHVRHEEGNCHAPTPADFYLFDDKAPYSHLTSLTDQVMILSTYLEDTRIPQK